VSTSRKIVVIDDSPSIRETIAFILESEGYAVITATNGREGLNLIRDTKPRAVLVDGVMPEMDGFELCRQVRTDATIAGTRVIMLTSMGQQVDQERARTVGVDHFLTKPFDEDEILALLDTIYGASEGGS
jgi:DNA-binding response OmpR family regulator